MACGFTSRQILATMKPTDPETMGFTSLGQIRLLQSLAQAGTDMGVPNVAATSQQPQPQQAPGHPNPPRSQPAGPLDTINSQLASLLGSLQPANNTPGDASPSHPEPSVAHRANPGEALYNPLSSLIPQQKPKYRDICDYVDMLEMDHEEVLAMGDGAHVVLRTNKRRLSLSQVSPMMWTSAAIRILLDLLRSGELAPDSILDYLAHMVKVAGLANSYIWSSVLAFDQAYRQQQAQLHFRWGTDTPYLATLHLIRRQVTPTTRKPISSSKQGIADKPQQVCRGFNKGDCKFGESCKYRHVCSVVGCGGKHPQSQHEEPKKG